MGRSRRDVLLGTGISRSELSQLRIHLSDEFPYGGDLCLEVGAIRAAQQGIELVDGFGYLLKC